MYFLRSGYIEKWYSEMKLRHQITVLWMYNVGYSEQIFWTTKHDYIENLVWQHCFILIGKLIITYLLFGVFSNINLIAKELVCILQSSMSKYKKQIIIYMYCKYKNRLRNEQVWYTCFMFVLTSLNMCSEL